jgi:3-dehydroquinate synthase
MPIETAGENKLYTHGEAVALGMLAASNLSEIISNLSNPEIERIKNLLVKLGIQTYFEKKDRYEFFNKTHGVR